MLSAAVASAQDAPGGAPQLRYAFFANARVSPYVVAGTGRGVERPNINEFFPHGVDRRIVVIYYGAGARIPIPVASTRSPTGD